MGGRGPRRAEETEEVIHTEKRQHNQQRAESVSSRRTAGPSATGSYRSGRDAAGAGASAPEVLGRGSWVLRWCFRTSARTGANSCKRRAAGVSRRLASVASATNGSNRVLTHAARRSFRSAARTSAYSRNGEPRTVSQRRKITQCTYLALPGLKSGARQIKNKRRFLLTAARREQKLPVAQNRSNGRCCSEKPCAHARGWPR